MTLNLFEAFILSLDPESNQCVVYCLATVHALRENGRHSLGGAMFRGGLRRQEALEDEDKRRLQGIHGLEARALRGLT